MISCGEAHEMIGYSRVTGDPAKVSHATEAVLRMDVKAVLHSHGGAEQEATNSVHDALWLACGAGGLKKVEYRNRDFKNVNLRKG